MVAGDYVPRLDVPGGCVAERRWKLAMISIVAPRRMACGRAGADPQIPGDVLNKGLRLETRIAEWVRKEQKVCVQAADMPVAESKIRRATMSSRHSIIPRVMIAVVR